MPILAVGTSLPNDISFNSGTLDINGFELAVIQDATIELKFSVKDIRALGTIKMVTAPKRHAWAPSCKGKLKSVNQQLFTLLMGSSSTDGSGLDYTVVDGQNVLTRASIKCYINENTSQAVEFQFSQAILSTSSVALKMEDAAEVDFEIVAQDCTVVTNFTT